jgi:hypothetical protein
MQVSFPFRKRFAEQHFRYSANSYRPNPGGTLARKPRSTV